MAGLLIIAAGVALILMAYALGHADGVMERDEAHQWERFDKLLDELKEKV